MFRLDSPGDWVNTRRFLHRLITRDYFDGLDRYGKMGVDALEAATPVDTRLTQRSWYYTIEQNHRYTRISWHNDNLTETGDPIVLLIQYGHGTGTGGYVEGHDFINPVIKPLFDQIADEVWKKVTR